MRALLKHSGGESMTVEDLKTLFDYSYWANAGLQDVLSQVTTAQFTQPVAAATARSATPWFTC